MFGPRAALDRAEQIGGVPAAIFVGATISATVALLCLSVGGVVADSEQSEFWRSWLPADACGSLVSSRSPWPGHSHRRATGRGARGGRRR
jgi:hypothetical protein